jgi:hypothetical protein
LATNAENCCPRDFCLLQENAHPPSAPATVEAMKEVKFELLPHPPYIPYLAASNCHMFGSPTEASLGRNFASDDAVKDAVRTWLWSQPKNFFADGVRRLVYRYTTCFEKNGVIMLRNDTLCICHRLLCTK